MMMTFVVFSCVVCATDWQMLYSTVQLRRICQTKPSVQYAGVVFVFVNIFVFVFVFAPLTGKVCICTAEKNLPNQTVCPLRCWIVWLCHYWLGPGVLWDLKAGKCKNEEKLIQREFQAEVEAKDGVRGIWINRKHSVFGKQLWNERGLRYQRRSLFLFLLFS